MYFKTWWLSAFLNTSKSTRNMCTTQNLQSGSRPTYCNRFGHLWTGANKQTYFLSHNDMTCRAFCIKISYMVTFRLGTERSRQLTKWSVSVIQCTATPRFTNLLKLRERGRGREGEGEGEKLAHLESGLYKYTTVYNHISIHRNLHVSI